MKAFADRFALRQDAYGLSDQTANLYASFIERIESGTEGLTLDACGTVFRGDTRCAGTSFHAAANNARRWTFLAHGDPPLIALEVSLSGRPSQVIVEGYWTTTFWRVWKYVQEAEGLVQTAYA